jgi:predicted small lipoprotein YifL
MKSALITLAITASLLTLGCGQKGPLYLPPVAQAAS